MQSCVQCSAVAETHAANGAPSVKVTPFPSDNVDNTNLLLRKMAVPPNPLFEPFDEDFVCLGCFRALTLHM